MEVGDGTIPGAPVIPVMQTRGHWMRTFSLQVIPELAEDWDAGLEVTPGLSIPEATTCFLIALTAAKDQEPLALEAWRHLTAIAPLVTVGYAPVNVRWVEECIVEPNGISEDMMQEKRDRVLVHMRLFLLLLEISGRSLLRTDRKMVFLDRAAEQGCVNLGEAIAAGVAAREEMYAANDIVHRQETVLPS